MAVEKLNGKRVAILATDVTAKDAPEKAVALAMSRFGRLDYLINNAGMGKPKPVDETTLLKTLHEVAPQDMPRPRAASDVRQGIGKGSSVLGN